MLGVSGTGDTVRDSTIPRRSRDGQAKSTVDPGARGSGAAEEPVAALARRYQVSEQTLYRWRDDFLAGGRQALGQKPGGQSQEAQRRIAKLEKEVANRAQVIGELSLANGLLKKLQASPD